MSSRRAAFDIVVSLVNTEPVVWRRLLLPRNITLPKVHEALQIAIGWENYHLHCFVVDKQRFGPVDPDFDDVMIDERRKRLDSILNESNDRIRYEYDFGDGWEHLIVLKDVFDVESGYPLPICIDGEGACPPEDVGGPHGYIEFLEAIRNKTHPRHDELVTWIGGEFDASFFDIHASNVLLGRCFRRDA